MVSLLVVFLSSHPFYVLIALEFLWFLIVVRRHLKKLSSGKRDYY